ncbi:hypothetical protein R1flu_003121 [Riccia fluitans]|uniref:Uncharacterized protein n=1 Tax=Riccia fluitans TaxID=41844 RepID=A0ABD1Y861_9MARC
MMSDDEDVHDEYSDDDIESIEEEALKLLESKKVVVEKADGTLRCPYSPSRKKQSYPYKDLLQHAEGVASGKKRGAEAVGKHKALAKYLKNHLSAKAAPPVQRVHQLELAVPERREEKDLLVWPWCGVVYNIDNSRRGENGQRVGIGNTELKKFFDPFHPEKVVVCWGPRGHMGLAVIYFRRDLEGFNDAQAFEKWFIEKEHGRRDWEKANDKNDLGTHLYGWLARKEDYEGRKETPNDWSISQKLKESGDLKDVAMLVEELTKMHDQRIQNLKETVTAKNDQFESLLHEVEVARQKAESIKQQLEEKHKKELEQIKLAALESTDRHARLMQEQNAKLQKSMEFLQQRWKELERKEHQNQVDKTRLEQEKKENQRHLDIINEESERQKKYQSHQVKLIQKHEEESKKLALLMQNMTLRLATKHQAEIEKQQMEEIKESKKFAELAESFEPSALATSYSKMLEDKMTDMEKKLAEYDARFESLNEEVENDQMTISNLTTKERAATEELENARKAALRVLLKHPKFGKEDGISVRRMGQIDDAPWLRECEKRFKNAKDGWQITCGTKLSAWGAKIMDPDFHCFKTVQVGNEDKWKRVLDENNEDLLALKEELGEEVLKSVTTALEEIEEWNPSGRYPIHVPWNSKTNRRATLSEIIELLRKAAVEGSKKKAPVKRRRVVDDDTI